MTVSFVPDGTQIGSEQSQLFADLNPTASTAAWQQNVFNMLQSAASQYNLNLQLVPDDGASMNGPAPQDGQLRIAGVDAAFQTAGPGMTLPGGGDLIVESQVTFGVGLGLTGPNGAPAQPPVSQAPPGTVAPNTPPSATLPFILPFPTAFGNLYLSPTATTAPTGPTMTSGPTATTAPTGMTAPTVTTAPTGMTGPTMTSGPSGPTATTAPTGPTYTSGPSGPTMTSGPSGPTVMTVSFVPDGTPIGNEQSQFFADVGSANAGVWEQNIFSELQSAASLQNVVLQLVPDDGVSLNAAAPEDGQIRIAAVDPAFLQGASAYQLPNGGYLVAEVPTTLGVGLGLIGPDGPLSPVPLVPPGVTAPGQAPSNTLPLILPFEPAFGNLYPLGPTTGPTGPVSGPTGTTGPSGPVSGPSGPTGMSEPTTLAEDITPVILSAEPPPIDAPPSSTGPTAPNLTVQSTALGLPLGTWLQTRLSPLLTTLAPVGMVQISVSGISFNTSNVSIVPISSKSALESQCGRGNAA